MVIAINRWKAGLQKKSSLFNRLLKADGQYYSPKILCKDLDNIYKNKGARGVKLTDEFIIPNKSPLPGPSTQLTPQLKKLRMVQTPTKPREITSSRLQGTKPVTRTVVRVIKVQCNKTEQNRRMCRLKKKIKCLKIDIRSSKQIAEQKLAAEKVCDSCLFFVYNPFTSWSEYIYRIMSHLNNIFIFTQRPNFVIKNFCSWLCISNL